MADEGATTEDGPITFHIKSSGNAKYTLTLPLSTTAIDLKNKLATVEYANIPPDSQRLIYSGRVLKDTDTLASHKVKEGNTMHLVKSAASNQRQNPAGQSSSGSAQSGTTPATPASSGVPTNLAAGTGNNPLAGLTGARYAGFAQLPGEGMFGPDGGMGPPPGPDQMIDMLSNPQFAQMMNEALQNPQMIDMMIQQNPQLRAMGPQARQILQSEQFRRMLTDPQTLRSMAQLQNAMGMSSFGGAGGQNAFPAPGETNTTPNSDQSPATPNSQPSQNAIPPQNPLSMFGNPVMLQGNPFAAMFNQPSTPQSAATTNTSNQPTSNQPTSNQQPTDNANTTNNPNPQQPAQNPWAMFMNPAMFGQQPQSNNSTTGSSPPQSAQSNPFLNNPLLNDPNLFNEFLRSMNGGNGGPPGSGAAGADTSGFFQNFLNSMGGMNNPPGPPDNRPPEERFSEQLRQLNDMGFYDFDRNIQALTRSGGSVQGAIEHLLGQP